MYVGVLLVFMVPLMLLPLIAACEPIIIMQALGPVMGHRVRQLTIIEALSSVDPRLSGYFARLEDGFPNSRSGNRTEVKNSDSLSV